MLRFASKLPTRLLVQDSPRASLVGEERQGAAAGRVLLRRKVVAICRLHRLLGVSGLSIQSMF